MSGSRELQHRLIAEVQHQINSPLAAIRNALYLAACRTDDPDVRQYIEMAQHEVSNINLRMKALRTSIEGAMELPWAVPSTESFETDSKTA